MAKMEGGQIWGTYLYYGVPIPGTTWKAVYEYELSSHPLCQRSATYGPRLHSGVDLVSGATKSLHIWFQQTLLPLKGNTILNRDITFLAFSLISACESTTSICRFEPRLTRQQSSLYQFGPLLTV